jgi:hypothetical protein
VDVRMLVDVDGKNDHTTFDHGDASKSKNCKLKIKKILSKIFQMFKVLTFKDPRGLFKINS